MTSRDVRLRTAVGFLTGTAVVSRVIGAATGVVTARALGPGGRGELAVLVLFGWIGGALAATGLDLWAARTVPEGGQSGAVSRVLRHHQLFTGLVTLAVVGGLVGVTDLRPDRVVAGAALAWFTASSMIKLGRLQGASRMRAYGIAVLTGTIAYAAAVTALGASGSSSVTAFLMANALGAVVTAAWPCPADSAPATTPVAYGSALRFGIPSMLGGLVTFGLYRFDVALVALWRSTAEAGIYAVALAVTEVLWVLPNSAAQAIVPRAARPVPSIDTARICRVLTAAMVLAAGVAVIGGWALVPVVFGSDFRDAVDALPALAAASVAIGIWKICSYHQLGRGDATTRLSSGFMGLIVMVAVDAVLVPTWGVVGASIGSLTGYVVAAALSVRALQSTTKLPWRSVLVLRRGDVRALRRVEAASPRELGDDGIVVVPDEQLDRGL